MPKAKILRLSVALLGCLSMAPPVQGVNQGLCPSGVGLTVSTHKPSSRHTTSLTEEVLVRPGQKLKVYVTISNTNASVDILDANMGLNLNDGVSYYKTFTQSDKSLPLPLADESVVRWGSLGPLGGTTKKTTFGVLLTLGECIPDEVEVPVAGIFLLGDNKTTCGVTGSRLTLKVRDSTTKKSMKKKCTNALPVGNVGKLCTSDSACGEAGTVCNDGRCSFPSTLNSCDPQSTNCGPGNHCIDYGNSQYYCTYCAKLGDGCGPPDKCPGQDQICKNKYPDSGRAECGWTWSFSYELGCVSQGGGWNPL